MHSITSALLFAAVAAEDGYTCSDADSSWTNADLAAAEITTNEECKTACDTAVAAGNPNDNDWCCAAVAVTEPASLACNLFSIATDGLDIRAESVDEEGTTSSAWAWDAGVASADLTPVEETPADDDAAEDDEDMSVRMTVSTLAAASIAMLAI